MIYSPYPILTARAVAVADFSSYTMTTPTDPANASMWASASSANRMTSGTEAVNDLWISPTATLHVLDQTQPDAVAGDITLAAAGSGAIQVQGTVGDVLRWTVTNW